MAGGARTDDVAHRLLEANRAGRIVQEIPRLYAPDVISVHDREGGGVVRGIAALTERMKERQASVEGDEIYSDGPYYLEEEGRNTRFAFVFERAWSSPADGPLERMSQLAVFEVEDDLIVREEVFLQPPRPRHVLAGARRPPDLAMRRS